MELLSTKFLPYAHHLPRSIFAELPERSIQERGFSPNSGAPGFSRGLGECTVTEVSCRDSDQVGRYCDRLVVPVRHEILAYDFPIVRRTVGRRADADGGKQYRQGGCNLCTVGLGGCQHHWAHARGGIGNVSQSLLTGCLVSTSIQHSLSDRRTG